jgi:diacylglycerol kinase family enzyme
MTSSSSTINNNTTSTTSTNSPNQIINKSYLPLPILDQSPHTPPYCKLPAESDNNNNNNELPSGYILAKHITMIGPPKKQKQQSLPVFRYAGKLLLESKITRVFLIYNFFGGGGKQTSKIKSNALQIFESILEQHQIKVTKQQTQRPKHVTEIILNLPINEYDICVVWGGDGSIQEAIDGYMTRNTTKNDNFAQRVPLTIVAGGSGNALAINFGLFKVGMSLKERAVLTANAIINGKIQSIDVGKATSGNRVVYFGLIFSWGNTIEFFYTCEYLRKRFHMGDSRYVWATLWYNFYKNYPKRPKTIAIIDDKYIVEWPQIWEANNKIGSGFTVSLTAEQRGYQTSPSSQIDDGKLEFSFSPNQTTKELQECMYAQLGGTALTSFEGKPPQIMYVRFTTLKLDWAPGEKPLRPSDLKCAADGSVLDGDFFPFELTCVKGAIQVLVPKEQEGVVSC